MTYRIGISIAACVCLLLGSCSPLARKHQAGAAVELDGQYIYYATLDSLTIGLSGEDSARVAEQYIQQWAKDVLVYQAARDNADKAIEAMVEDYRRSLYVHAYEKKLVDKRMPKQVADSVIESIYATHTNDFILQETLVKGMLIVVPNETPNINKLKHWMTNLSNQNLEEIEKYAYQYATGYELFKDSWVTEQQLVLHMPFERNELSSLIRQKSQIELRDSISTWILQVDQKLLKGDRMPLDYARPEIEKAVLSRRQVDFLQRERDKLYEQTILLQKIRFYEKN